MISGLAARADPAVAEARLRHGIRSVGVCPVAFGVIFQRLARRAQRFLRFGVVDIIIFHRSGGIFRSFRFTFRHFEFFGTHKREIAHVFPFVTAGFQPVFPRCRRNFPSGSRHRVIFGQRQRNVVIRAVRYKRISLGCVHVFVKPVAVYPAENRIKITEIHRVFRYAETMIRRRQGGDERDFQRNFFARLQRRQQRNAKQIAIFALDRPFSAALYAKNFNLSVRFPRIVRRCFHAFGNRLIYGVLAIRVRVQIEFKLRGRAVPTVFVRKRFFARQRARFRVVSQPQFVKSRRGFLRFFARRTPRHKYGGKNQTQQNAQFFHKK